jgi:hypothetical protein
MTQTELDEVLSGICAVVKKAKSPSTANRDLQIRLMGIGCLVSKNGGFEWQNPTRAATQAKSLRDTIKKKRGQIVVHWRTSGRVELIDSFDEAAALIGGIAPKTINMTMSLLKRQGYSSSTFHCYNEHGQEDVATVERIPVDELDTWMKNLQKRG